MAEILLRVKDKVNAEFHLNVKCTKRGDVIVACQDGWTWGLRELDRPDYRVIRIPGMDVSEAQALVAEEPETDPQHPSSVLQRRAFRLDLEHPGLSAAFRDWLADDSRAIPIWEFDLPIQAFRALKTKKPKLDDPLVIG